jgi:hypothetical protein
MIELTQHQLEILDAINRGQPIQLRNLRNEWNKVDSTNLSVLYVLHYSDRLRLVSDPVGYKRVGNFVINRTTNKVGYVRSAGLGLEIALEGPDFGGVAIVTGYQNLCQWELVSIEERIKHIMCGKEPHRWGGWTHEHLPFGWRPLWDGEDSRPNDEQIFGPQWVVMGHKYPSLPASSRDLHLRTQRPIVPRYVDLTWEDVPPRSCVRSKPGHWFHVMFCNDDGVRISNGGDADTKSFHELHLRWEIDRGDGQGWVKCRKEAK